MSKKKILAALSGGVDSSVAAALLQDQGYNVTGVFCHFWKEKDSGGEEIIANKCCSKDAETAARQVCQKLDIPFYTFNFSKQFKKEIVDSFIAAYANGETPNPCVACNEKIKFGLLLKKARALGFDLLATGHYARPLPLPPLKRGGNAKTSLSRLLKGKDPDRDQSYFLYNLKQDDLKYLLFPVGNLLKTEVRKIAVKKKLPTAKREESQGICFIKEKKHNEFLKRHLKKINSGEIVDQENNVIGNHEGLPFYTLGQRTGIKIGGTGPYYVYARDFKKNLLRVTRDYAGNELLAREISCHQANWISGGPPKTPLKIAVKIRYQKTETAGELIKASRRNFTIKLKIPVRAAMKGQSAVLFRGDEVIGGGIII